VWFLNPVVSKIVMHLFLAVQDVKVWTLERVAYQQIMKTSAMRRFDERVGFLKSVPLMKDLNEEFLTKIADVLKEVRHSTTENIL